MRASCVAHSLVLMCRRPCRAVIMGGGRRQALLQGLHPLHHPRDACQRRHAAHGGEGHSAPEPAVTSAQQPQRQRPPQLQVWCFVVVGGAPPQLGFGARRLCCDGCQCPALLLRKQRACACCSAWPLELIPCGCCPLPCVPPSAAGMAWSGWGSSCVGGGRCGVFLLMATAL